MKVSMMQPGFMPWQGLFELIYKSDAFVFLDDFQFSVQSWHQRNRLFVNKNQIDWYTVPVRKTISFRAALNQTVINESVPWRVKLWKRIQQNYSKAPFFPEISRSVETWLSQEMGSLAAQNIAFINMVCKLIGLDREMRLSSNYSCSSGRSQKVLELLRWCKASRYLCAKGSFDYMREDGIFPVIDVEVLFQDFQPRGYKQIGSPERFVPYLSVLDTLMNIGPDHTGELIKKGTEKWLTWEERLQGSLEHKGHCDA